MPRPVPSLLACLALALGLALPARAPADPPGAAGEPLTVAMDAGHAPYTLLDAAGRPAGLFVDIWTLWSRKTGRPVRFAPAPREEALAAVPAGRADIHAGRIDTPELREGQDLSSPFYHLSLHLFVLSGPDAPRDLEALAGRRVGAGPGAFPLEALHQVLPRAEAAAFADLDAGFTALASGRIRALLAEAEPGRLAMTRLGLSGAVEAREMHLGGQVRAMVGRGKPGLLALVDRGLAAISEEEDRKSTRLNSSH